MADINKTISIRASDSVRERFQALIEADPDLKANDILEKLLSTYETSMKEAALPEFESDFKDFASHLHAINIKFHNVYSMLANAEQTAAMGFERQLSENRDTIENLNEQLKTFKEKYSVLMTELKVKEENANAAAAAKEAAQKTSEQLVKDKEDLRKQNESLEQQLNEVKEREANLEKLNADQALKLSEFEHYPERLNNLQKKFTNGLNEAALKERSLQEQLTSQFHENTLKDNAIREANEKYDNLNKLNEEIKKEKEEIASRLEQANQKIDSMKTELIELAVLKSQVVSLKEQLEAEKKRSDLLQNTLITKFSNDNNSSSQKKEGSETTPQS